MKKIIILLTLLLIICGCSTSNDEVVQEETIEYSECLGGGYFIPEEFGKPQYSVEEIRMMKDYSLQELKDSISTIADLAQWYYESGFVKNKALGDYKQLLDNGYILSLHASPQAAFDSQYTCCGCISTLSNYILEGDYPEEGYILTADCSDNQPHGGHVYNYFTNENGEYLTVDFLGTKVGIIDRCYRLESLEDLVKHNRENNDYLYVMVAIKDHCGNVPALYCGIDNGHGCTLAWFFDSYYEDKIVKINYDIDQINKFGPIYKTTNLIEDLGFDPSCIDQQKVDNYIGSWESGPRD